MSETYTTQIDSRYRPGALKGLVNPRERYEVEKISEHEIRFRRLVPAEHPACRLIKHQGRTVLSRGAGNILTQAEVNKALEQFP